MSDLETLSTKAVLPLPDAATILGISRATAYKLAAEDSFPCPLVRIGGRIVVPTAGLRALLGMEAA